MCQNTYYQNDESINKKIGDSMSFFVQLKASCLLRDSQMDLHWYFFQNYSLTEMKLLPVHYKKQLFRLGKRRCHILVNFYLPFLVSDINDTSKSRLLSGIAFKFIISKVFFIFRLFKFYLYIKNLFWKIKIVLNYIYSAEYIVFIAFGNSYMEQPFK